MRIPFSFILLVLILAEIAGFIVIGGAIGVLATLGLVLFGMVAGVMLLRWQGLSTIGRIRQEMEAGRTPAKPLAEGAVMTVAALLLILPGFITDIIGAILFIPAVRSRIWRAASGRIKVKSTVSGGASRPAYVNAIDLDQSEYDSQPRQDSPWRQNGGPQA